MNRRLPNTPVVLCAMFAVGCSAATRVQQSSRADGKANLRPSEQVSAAVDPLEFDPRAIPQRPVPRVDYARYRTKDGPTLVVQDMHPRWVTHMAFSPDGRFLASSGYGDGSLKLWTLDGRLIRTIRPYTKSNASTDVQGIAFSPDGELLALGFTFALSLWTLDGKEVRRLQFGYDTPDRISFDPSGKHVLGVGGAVRFFDVDFDLDRDHLELDASANVSAISPDGVTVALWDGFYTKGPEGKAYIYRVGSRQAETLVSFPHGTQVRAMAFRPDGKALAVAVEPQDGKGTINLYDLKRHLLKGLDETARVLAFSPEGSLLVSAAIGKTAASNTLTLWNGRGERLKTIPVPEGVYALTFNHDGTMFATASHDAAITLWDRDGNRLNTFNKTIHWTNAAQFSPDGTPLLVAASEDEVRLRNLDGSPVWMHAGLGDTYFRDAMFSPDGRTIVAIGGEKTPRFHVWRQDGTPERLIEPAYCSWRCFVALSPDSKLALLPGPEAKSVDVWSLGGVKLRTMALSERGINAVAFTPDGTTIATSEDAPPRILEIRGMRKSDAPSSVKFWDAATGNLLSETAMDGNVRQLAFSPNGNLLAAAAGSLILMERVPGTTGYRLLRSFGSERDTSVEYENYTLVAWRPDSTAVAVGDVNHSDIILFALDGARLRTFHGHADMVTHLSFSPDGRHLVSTSRDSTTRIWNVETGDHVALVAAGDEWLMVTPDGYFDASRGGGQLASMVNGMDVYAVDQFALKKNRPDVILKRIGLGSEEIIQHYAAQYRKRLRRSGLTEEQLAGDYNAPETVISAIKQGGKYAEVAFTLTDAKSDLRSYNVFVNDVPIFGATGKVASGRQLLATERVELGAGVNKIEVSGTNQAGAEAYRALAWAHYDTEVKGDLYYLGFGVSKYQDRSLNLEFADKDAKDLATLFASMSGHFAEFHSLVLMDGEVTTSRITEAKQFLAKAKVDDTMVLFIAGHGVHDEDPEATYYFITYDTDIRALSKTAAPFELIEDLLQGIAPRQKLFLMDTCESGDVDREAEQQYLAIASQHGLQSRGLRGLKVVSSRTSTRHTGPRTYLRERDRYIYNDLVRRSGAIVFSSSQGGEFSYEDARIRNGYFSHEIMAALTGKAADVDGNGVVSIDELRDFVATAVASRTSGAQHPTIDRDNIYMRFGFPVSTPPASSR